MPEIFQTSSLMKNILIPSPPKQNTQQALVQKTPFRLDEVTVILFCYTMSSSPNSKTYSQVKISWLF